MGEHSPFQFGDFIPYFHTCVRVHIVMKKKQLCWVLVRKKSEEPPFGFCQCLEIMLATYLTFASNPQESCLQCSKDNNHDLPSCWSCLYYHQLSEDDATPLIAFSSWLKMRILGFITLNDLGQKAFSHSIKLRILGLILDKKLSPTVSKWESHVSSWTNIFLPQY